MVCFDLLRLPLTVLIHGALEWEAVRTPRERIDRRHWPPSLILRRYQRTDLRQGDGNRRVAQFVLNHAIIESTVRYHDVDVERPLELSVQTEA